MNDFPKNLFDALGAEMPMEQPDDFIPTLMYILNSVGSYNDTATIIMHFQQNKSFDDIGNKLGFTRQRAHMLVQNTLARISPNHIEMLKYGLKKYTENILEARIKNLSDIIVDSTTEEVKNNCYNEGYAKGFADATANRKENSGNRTTLDNILVETLGLSVRTFNACKRNHLNTIGDILNCGDKIQNCSYLGQRCFRELARSLEDLDINTSEYFPITTKIWGVAPYGKTV